MNETTTAVMPAFLASALVNGDLSGIEQKPDLDLYEACVKYCEGYSIVDVGEPYFSNSIDVPGERFAGDVAEYVLLKIA